MKRLVAIMPLVLLLTGCTVPAEWAARLHADGSVDILSCWGPRHEVKVDYLLPDEYSGHSRIEWRAEIEDDSLSEVRSYSVDVFRYGEVPEHWKELIEALPAPDGWTSVETSAGIADRDELEVDEWVWFTTDRRFDWIPPQPCDGWELGPDGEPRRTT